MSTKSLWNTIKTDTSHPVWVMLRFMVVAGTLRAITSEFDTEYYVLIAALIMEAPGMIQRMVK